MIDVICLGKIKEKYLVDLIEDYKKRISKYLKLNIIELPDDNNISIEEERIVSKIDKKSLLVLLDIEGKSMDSVSFSNFIEKSFINYPKITFIIGGSTGVTDKIKNIVNVRLSFSSMTFPHGLFRGILLEQIYRACKISHNETYHK